jgi:hypothetical protein
MSEVAFERVLTNGVQLSCAVTGDGPELFLLHGFPELWRCWEPQIEELARDFRLVIPDLRGCGWSDKPVSGYGARSVAADLYGLIRHFCGRRRAARSASTAFPASTSTPAAPTSSSPAPRRRRWSGTAPLHATATPAPGSCAARPMCRCR